MAAWAMYSALFDHFGILAFKGRLTGHCCFHRIPCCAAPTLLPAQPRFLCQVHETFGAPGLMTSLRSRPLGIGSSFFTIFSSPCWIRLRTDLLFLVGGLVFGHTFTMPLVTGTTSTCGSATRRRGQAHERTGPASCCRRPFQRLPRKTRITAVDLLCQLLSTGSSGGHRHCHQNATQARPVVPGPSHRADVEAKFYRWTCLLELRTHGTSSVSGSFTPLGLNRIVMDSTTCMPPHQNTSSSAGGCPTPSGPAKGLSCSSSLTIRGPQLEGVSFRVRLGTAWGHLPGEEGRSISVWVAGQSQWPLLLAGRQGQLSLWNPIDGSLIHWTES